MVEWERTVRNESAIAKPGDLQDLLRKLNQDIVAGMVWSAAAVHELGSGQLQPTRKHSFKY